MTTENNKKESEVKTDETLINHIRNVKLLQAIYGGKKFFVECSPTDTDARHFPNSNFAVKEIQLPEFDLFEEKLGYKWVKEPATPPSIEGDIKSKEESAEKKYPYQEWSENKGIHCSENDIVDHMRTAYIEGLTGASQFTASKEKEYREALERIIFLPNSISMSYEMKQIATEALNK